MTTKNVLLSLTIAGVTLFSIYEVKKHVEKKYATVNEEVSEEVKESKIANTVEKVKKQIKKYTRKFVDLITEYQTEIDSLTSLIGFVAAMFTLKGAVRESKTPNYIPRAFQDKNIVDRMLEERKGIIENCPNGEALRWNVISPKEKKEDKFFEDQNIAEFVSYLAANTDYGTIRCGNVANKAIHYTVDTLEGGTV